MNIVIYTKEHCPNCVMAKMVMDMQGLKYEERNVDMEEWRVQFTEHFPEIRQLPQIFFDGQRVGGLSGLQAALKQLEMR